MLIETGYGLSLNRKNNAGGGGASAYLDGVISSVCCDLDATVSYSYGGSGQIWANLIASPADGAAQTDYDFYLGADGSASTDDPTFDADKFTFDGGDHFRLKNGNTPLIRDGHKTTGGTAITFGLAFRTPSSLAANWALGGSSLAGGANYGFDIQHFNTGNEVRLRHVAGSNPTVTISTLSMTLAADTDYLMLISFDFTNSILKTWLNTTTGTTETMTAPSATTINSDEVLAIGAAISGGAAALPLTSGHAVYWHGLFNEIIDDTKAADIFAHLETRHGRDYTGS